MTKFRNERHFLIYVPDNSVVPFHDPTDYRLQEYLALSEEELNSIDLVPVTGTGASQSSL